MAWAHGVAAVDGVAAADAATAAHQVAAAHGVAAARGTAAVHGEAATHGVAKTPRGAIGHEGAARTHWAAKLAERRSTGYPCASAHKHVLPLNSTVRMHAGRVTTHAAEAEFCKCVRCEHVGDCATRRLWQEEAASGGSAKGGPGGATPNASGRGNIPTAGPLRHASAGISEPRPIAQQLLEARRAQRRPTGVDEELHHASIAAADLDLARGS